MFSVFLVEDEIVAREGIRNSIPWENTPYTLVGEAPDGEIALPIIRDIKPDILITDIKMPFMDGLALARIVRKDQPWMKIIILSGHDEFQYAKEAISIGVEEYLLKPVSAAEMIRSLDKVARQIVEEKERLDHVESLEIRVQSSDEIIRERFLNDMVIGLMENEDIIGKSHEMGLDLLPGGYVVMVVDFPIDSDDFRQCAKAKSLLDFLVKDRHEIIHFSQSVEKEILLFKHMNESLVDEAIYPLAQSLKFEIERNTDCKVSIGIGSVVDHLHETKRSYAYAYNAMRYMAQSRERTIISAGDLQMEDRYAPEDPDANASIHSRHLTIIKKAKEHIKQSYHKSDISLQSVAAHVYMSPNHFSTVFSQGSGTTFIEYLTSVRIKRAKQLLLESDMRCSDITYETGYSDPHYFSFIFKKQTGMSPREYRSTFRK
jgi:two-component system response regulator YesN